LFLTLGGDILNELTSIFTYGEIRKEGLETVAAMPDEGEDNKKDWKFWSRVVFKCVQLCVQIVIGWLCLLVKIRDMASLLSGSILNWGFNDYFLWFGFCFQLGGLIQIPFFIFRGYVASFAHLNLDDHNFRQWKSVAGYIVETVRQDCGWIWGFIACNEILENYVMAAEFLKMDKMVPRLHTVQLSSPALKDVVAGKKRAPSMQLSNAWVME